jgi:hypothetical protein
MIIVSANDAALLRPCLTTVGEAPRLSLAYDTKL